MVVFGCYKFVGWNVVTTPKKLGGLGVREARIINVSLLDKFIWQLMGGSQTLG